VGADSSFLDFDGFVVAEVLEGGRMVMRNCTFANNTLPAEYSASPDPYATWSVTILGGDCDIEKLGTPDTLVLCEGCHFPDSVPFVTVPTGNITGSVFSDNTDDEVYPLDYPFLCYDDVYMSDFTTSEPPQSLDKWPAGVTQPSKDVQWFIDAQYVRSNWYFRTCT
jgi:hypothetical protein